MWNKDQHTKIKGEVTAHSVLKAGGTRLWWRMSSLRSWAHSARRQTERTSVACYDWRFHNSLEDWATTWVQLVWTQWIWWVLNPSHSPEWSKTWYALYFSTKKKKKATTSHHVILTDSNGWFDSAKNSQPSMRALPVHLAHLRKYHLFTSCRQ